MKGRPRGFSASAFDSCKSDFPRFFNLTGVKTAAELCQVWGKYVSPSLCPDTGIYNVLKAGAKEVSVYIILVSPTIQVI